MASLNTGMPAINYGSHMSMSEQLTFRQDVRLASGKLKLWCKEQSNNKLSTSNKWLEYI